MKDLVIGGCNGFEYEQLKYWINSIKISGFTGDMVIVATNISGKSIEKLKEENVILALYGKQTETGGAEYESHTAPHVERFFYIWQYLTAAPEYNNVIMTDVRDVIFQRNPSIWLQENMHGALLVCSSEELKYKDEPWGNTNIEQTLGPFIAGMYKDKKIYNVGTIAGKSDVIKDVCLQIVLMSAGRPIKVVDQAIFNMLINQKAYYDITKFTNNHDTWAIQLGTTEKAVKAGAGEIGIRAANNPSELIMYQMNYLGVQPIIKGNMVLTDTGDPYTIVHQYDRIPELKELIERKFS